jgi:hypothetical protein
MAVKLAELSTARVALVVAAAAVEVVGRGLAIVVAVVAIYRLVYSYSPLYSTNTY